MENKKNNFELMTLEELNAEALKDSAEANIQLARRYLLGEGVQADTEKYMQHLSRAAELGSVKAQVTLGAEYKYQLKNYLEAVKWFARAAESNYAPAQYMLGYCYLQGSGVEQNTDRGIELLKKSAEQNDICACRELSRCYEEGKWVETDLKEASKWLKKCRSLKQSG